jgi:TolA-binding protein
MRKVLLVAVVLSFVLSGCGSDQYMIERDYWKVNKQAQAVFKNPVATPPKKIEHVVAVLNKFIAGHPKNVLAVRADFTIAKVYLAKGMYERARSHLKTMAKKYAVSAAIVSETIFLTGSSYQLQNNPDAAIAQYRAIISKYPLSPRGLQMPIYIAQVYASRHEPVNMQQAYKDAIVHYESLAQKDMKSALALRAYMLVAECYGGMKDWPQSIAALEKIIANFKDRASMDGVLMNIAIVYYRELQDKEKGKAVLSRLVKDYPASRYAKAAQELLRK